MWALWKERLDATFNGVYWSPAKLIQKIWLGLVDYGRNDWDRMRMQGGSSDKFSATWCRNSIIVQMLGKNPIGISPALLARSISLVGVTVLALLLSVVLASVWFSLAGTGGGGLCPVFSAVKMYLYLFQKKKKKKNHIHRMKY
jgi:hypothetical protein